ncbi:MAG: uroporphyrinogen decarboxylase family protein [Planctomycetota bacterium]
MNHRERFAAIMNFKPVDRVPVYYFGTWDETRVRWEDEGLKTLPEVPGLDPDWERGMWDCHGLVNTRAITDRKAVVLEETDDHRVVRTALGAVIREGKHGSSIPMHVEEALKPTRAAWREFKKMLDTTDPRRRPAGWEAQAAQVDKRERVTTFLAGSLYGWPRDWMGVEAWSLLAYDDPALYGEIIEFIADYFIALYTPVLKKVRFEFGYFFEDCCFKNGPLFSPDIFRTYYMQHYRRLNAFYHKAGVPLMLVDSDGKVDQLVPLWLDAGFDIIFPIEVGTWKGNPVAFRKEYGKRIRIFGGVDKNVFPQGAAAIRKELKPLVPVVREGGFIPIPDHRIPPDCSLADFKTYIEVFNRNL